VLDAHRQLPYRVRFEWGPAAAEALAPACDVAVVVDVLSFTTTLSVAADRGIDVICCPDDGTAGALAAERDAVAAYRRRIAPSAGVSLSPASVRSAPGPLHRIVLPSPNGSAISARLATSGAVVVGACLRNCRAVAHDLLRRAAAGPRLSVLVLAAGERWPDGSLRPAVEDLWGAGAVVAALLEGGWAPATLSPEARVAAAAFSAVSQHLVDDLLGCASGRELVERGFADDVRIAAELDSSVAVPCLQGDVYVV